MQGLIIRPYKEKDFLAIHKLNIEEGWNNLAARQQQTKAAWQGSNVAVVAIFDGQLIACIRALTDGFITLYICELLIEKSWRGNGIGAKLMDYVHSLYPETRLELIAGNTSRSYYEAKNFRAFHGFRKTFKE